MTRMLSSSWYQMSLEFSHRVPLVIGTSTIGRIINVIRESEIDHLSMPWATVRMA